MHWLGGDSGSNLGVINFLQSGIAEWLEPAPSNPGFESSSSVVSNKIGNVDYNVITTNTA